MSKDESACLGGKRHEFTEIREVRQERAHIRLVRVGCRWAFVLLSEFSLLSTTHRHLGETQMAGGRARKPRGNGGELLHRCHRGDCVLCGAPMEKMASFPITETRVAS